MNEIFDQERVAWKLVDLQMVAMQLSKGDGDGDGADAVTDAGTALQELLTELGCKGNQLGNLIKSASKMDLLAAHDAPLLDAIEKALNSVAADRSETGESHHASDAGREDAWLIVHIVGAFVVRLAAGEKRPS